MATIKQISDAIIARLEDQVAGISASVFDGDARDYLDQVKAVPFAGLTLEDLDQVDQDVSGKTAVERLLFKVLLIAEDFSGMGYSIESCYGYLDGVRNALMGWSPLAGVFPIVIDQAEKNREMEAEKITAYDIRISTSHVVQQTG